MDADRFDSLARSFITPSSRRSIVSLLGAAGFGGVLASTLAEDAEAKKKKKKKCKPCRKKKKGKCKGKKPDGTPCGGENVCQGGQCVPPSPPTCDPPCVAPEVCEDGQCVAPPCDPPCVAPQECVAGVCTCPGGTIPCGDECIEDVLCCTDADCGGDILTCEDNVCTCPDPSDLPCSASECCDTATDEVCDIQTETCLSGCPATDFCAVEDIFFCDFTCACVTSIDDATVCSDFLNSDCTECATDAECTTLLGQDAVCVPNGEFCDFCDSDLASFCVAVECSSGAPLQSQSAGRSFRKGGLKLKR